MAKSANMIAKFKRRSLVDGIFQIGIILVIIGFGPLLWLYEVLIVCIACYVLISCGIFFLFYGIYKHHYLLKNNPEYLMPEDAQINAKVAHLLTDNISEGSKVEIAKVLTNATTPHKLGE